MAAMNFNQIDLKVKKIMTRERYHHSWQVSKVAEEMAEYYHISAEKAKILGLIHDCAKDYSIADLKELMNKYNIHLSQIEKNIPGLWHAYVGAEVARELFKVQDQEMLEAIKFHSTASSNLGLLGKIVYIADKIEPGREMQKLPKIRELVWRDIDQAMLELLNQGLRHLISRNLLIHPKTLQARNRIIFEQKERFDNGKIR